MGDFNHSTSLFGMMRTTPGAEVDDFLNTDSFDPLMVAVGFAICIGVIIIPCFLVLNIRYCCRSRGQGNWRTFCKNYFNCTWLKEDLGCINPPDHGAVNDEANQSGRSSPVDWDPPTYNTALTMRRLDSLEIKGDPPPMYSSLDLTDIHKNWHDNLAFDDVPTISRHVGMATVPVLMQSLDDQAASISDEQMSCPSTDFHVTFSSSSLQPEDPHRISPWLLHVRNCHDLDIVHETCHVPIEEVECTDDRVSHSVNDLRDEVDRLGLQEVDEGDSNPRGTPQNVQIVMNEPLATCQLEDMSRDLTCDELPSYHEAVRGVTSSTNL